MIIIVTMSLGHEERTNQIGLRQNKWWTLVPGWYCLRWSVSLWSVKWMDASVRGKKPMFTMLSQKMVQTEPLR